MSEKSREEFIDEELVEVKAKAPNIECVTVVTCVAINIRISIKITETKHVILIMMFPPKYPHEPLVVECKSKTLSDKLMGCIEKICKDKAEASWLGQKQLLPMIHFVKSFLEDNPLCVCNDEIASVKRDYVKGDDECKVKQKTSEVIFKIKQEKYFMNFKTGVPEGYPAKQVSVEILENSFPELLKVNFQAQAIEVARKCVQPPLKPKPGDPPFKPTPSLTAVCKFLIGDCIKKFPVECCPICKERVLPNDPDEKVEKKKRVERVYCGHLFHFGCLGVYLKTPPFSNGKFCQGCGKQIFHEKWKVTPQLAEARWAHKQARQRELAEVQDFLE